MTIVDRPSANRFNNPAPKRTVVGTGSRGSRILGALALAGSVAVAVLGLLLTEPDKVINPDTGDVLGQWDAVRLLYVHVPSAIACYAAFSMTAVASAMYLWKRSRAWDILAYTSAEIGVMFTALMLVTGSIWGKPVWNTWWRWGDARLMTSLLMLLMYVGYLAFRSVAKQSESQARQAAVIGLLSALIIPIVNRSVEWWPNRTIHQKSTFLAGKFDGLTFFTALLSVLVFLAIFAWLAMHRFRLGWMDHQSSERRLENTIADRRAEAAEAAENFARSVAPAASPTSGEQE